METNCVFCHIVQGQVFSRKVMENEQVYAFYDANPQAPVHILIVPKEHISTVNDLQPEHSSLVGEMFLIAQEIAREHEIDQRGYRLVMNCNREAGQSVYHIHLHLLGGRRMKWPPG
jgi:histidine triad (HIT) family protein